MAAAQPSQGSKLQIESAPSSGSYLDIVGVQESPQLAISNTLVEKTDLLDTFKSFVKTMAGGQLSFTVNWLPQDAVHILLLAACVSGIATNFRMVFEFTSSGGADVTHTFSAIVESYQRSATVAGVQKLQVSLTINSLPVVT